MALFAQNDFKWPPLRFGHIQRNYDLLFRDNGASADAPLSRSYRKPQAKLVEEKSRSVETVEKEPPFAIIRSR